MPSRTPALQFYPADWRKDPGVQSLDYFDRGVWFELLMIMHESSERGKLALNGLAMTEKDIALLVGLDEAKLKQTLSKLEAKGVAKREQNTSKIYCKRMVEDEAKAAAKMQKRERIREVRREAGRKGGQANRKQKPSMSSSSITNNPISPLPNEPFNPPLEAESENPVMDALLKVCGIDLEQTSADDRNEIVAAYEYVTRVESPSPPLDIARLLREFARWHFEISWPGKAPWPKRIRQKWAEFKLWKNNGRAKQDAKPAKWSNQSPEDRRVAEEYAERLNAGTKPIQRVRN